MIYTTEQELELIKTRPLYWINKPVADVEFGLYKRGSKYDSVPDIPLLQDDFCVSGNEFWYESDGDFPIGCAISKACKLTLKRSDKYTVQDFEGGFVEIIVTIDEDDDVSPWMFTGRYYVQRAYDDNGKIVIEGNDAMALTDKLFTPPSGIDSNWTVSNRTILMLYTWMSEELGFEILHNNLYNSDGEIIKEAFTNCNYVFPKRPYGYTYRELFGFIAMIAGGNAVIPPMGEGVRIEELPDTEQVLDKWISITPEGKSIVLSGVIGLEKYDINADELDTPIEHRSNLFSSGHVLTVDNPLINFNVSTPVDTLAQKLVGRSFRDFTGEHISYPPAEFGDLVKCEHANGSFYTHLTAARWAPAGASRFECSVQDMSNLSLYCDIIYSTDYATDSVPENKLVLEEYALTAEDIPELEYGDLTFGGWHYDESFKRIAEADDRIVSNVHLYAKWALNEDQYNSGYAAGYAQSQVDGVSSGAHPSESSVSVPVYRPLYISVTTDSAGSTVYQIEEKGQRWELLGDDVSASYKIGYEEGYKYGYRYASILDGEYLEALEYIWDEPTATLTVEETVGLSSSLPANTYEEG